MVTEHGEVIEIIGTNARIKVSRSDACESCSTRHSCHAMGSSPTDMEIEMENSIGAKKGDKILLSLPTSSLIKMSFLMYIVPVIVMIAGGIVGKNIAQSFNLDENGCAVISCILFFFASLFIIRSFSERITKNPKYRPKMVKVVSYFKPDDNADGSDVI